MKIKPGTEKLGAGLVLGFGLDLGLGLSPGMSLVMFNTFCVSIDTSNVFQNRDVFIHTGW